MKLETVTCVAGVIALGLCGVANATQTYKGQPVDAKTCQGAWSMASPHGDTLSKGQVDESVINFSMVDSNHDAKIDAKEFQRGCEKGLVKADAFTAKDME